MKKTAADMQDIYRLHQAGHLQEAEREYLAVIDKNPREIAALHGLAILYVQLRELEKARYYLEQALHYSPNDSTIVLHLANVLKSQGLFSQAAQILQDLIKVHPQFTPAYNNLDSVYYAQGKLAEAVNCYYHAIELQSDY